MPRVPLRWQNPHSKSSSTRAPSTNPGTPVRAGDILGGCTSGDTLQVIATKPNQMLYETTFA
jgi:hypothetical protein